MGVAVICSYFFFCFLIAWWARRWGRNAVLYFILSFLYTPLVAALVLVHKQRRDALGRIFGGAVFLATVVYLAYELLKGPTNPYAGRQGALWLSAILPLIILGLPGLYVAVVVGWYPKWGKRVELFRREPPPSASQETESKMVEAQISARQTAEAAYLKKVLVKGVAVGKPELVETGVSGALWNIGDRTLKQVEIAIHCLGVDGKPVFEKKHHPVLVSDRMLVASGQPLKLGYSRQFAVKLDEAPSNWGREIDVEVTRIEFQ